MEYSSGFVLGVCDGNKKIARISSSAVKPQKDFSSKHIFEIEERIVRIPQKPFEEVFIPDPRGTIVGYIPVFEKLRGITKEVKGELVCRLGYYEVALDYRVIWG